MQPPLALSDAMHIASMKTQVLLGALTLGAFSIAGSQPPTGSVTKIESTARPKVFNGKCPATIRFTAVIYVSGPTTVEYQWERSDGATDEKKTIQIRGKGMGVNDTWQLGDVGNHLKVWEKLHVISPNAMFSLPAEAVINCRADGNTPPVRGQTVSGDTVPTRPVRVQPIHSQSVPRDSLHARPVRVQPIHRQVVPRDSLRVRPTRVPPVRRQPVPRDSLRVRPTRVPPVRRQPVPRDSLRVQRIRR